MQYALVGDLLVVTTQLVGLHSSSAQETKTVGEFKHVVSS